MIGWKLACSELTYFKDHKLSIIFQDNIIATRTEKLEPKLSDLFVDAATFDKDAENNTIKCYLAIFPNKLDSSTTPEANQWFIGSKLLGNMTVVFDNVYQRD